MKIVLVQVRTVLVVLFAAMTVFSFAATASAQEEATAEYKQAARAAMLATGATERMDKILIELASFTKAGLIASRPDIESEITNIVDEVAISLAERRGALEQEVASIFMKFFTQEELEAISAFFGSETGVKFLRTTPALFGEVDESSRVWRDGINREMSQMVTEKLKEKGLQ